MLAAILVATCVFCYLAYRIYGGFLSRHCRLDDERETPASSQEDGVDYVPTRASVLFGHHFSSIAGAGPIVGPILAATYFGWGPTWAWILVGAVLVGGVHDFGSTHVGAKRRRSIADTVRNLLGRGGNDFRLRGVGVDLCHRFGPDRNTFQEQPEVATASAWLLLRPWLWLGHCVKWFPWERRYGCLFHLPLRAWLSDIAFRPDWTTRLGFPLPWATAVALTHCVLLQPRDFLSSFTPSSGSVCSVCCLKVDPTGCIY